MNTVNICRPGFRASCALCCGSHNYNVSWPFIEKLFRKRRKIFKSYSPDYLISQMRACRSDLTGSYYPHRTIDENILITLPKLYEDALQCPFVCKLDKGLIGCILYPDKGNDDARFDCFQSYTCKYFSCPAKDILTDEEILYAAQLFQDWYYYSLFIHSIELLRMFKTAHPILSEITWDEYQALKQNLRERLYEGKNLHTIHTYFT